VKGGPQCRFEIVGLGCGKAWQGWVFGSSEVDGATQHLAITASPSRVTDLAKIVNGPGWYPGERVRMAGSETIRRWRARWVFVPPGTNQGSAFARHLVLVWSVGTHTYAVGFHETSTMAIARAMDLTLVRHLRLIGS
jgi:hypothetical protein